MIPFKYRDREFYNCTTIGHNINDPLDGPPMSSPWCTTKRDNDGNHQEGNWEECGPNCSQLGEDRYL